VTYAARQEGRVYQRVLHPDLVDLQAHHDEDRLPIIKHALEGYDPRNKKLVDIGAHWGQMSAAMENLGFDVTAVEANAQKRQVHENFAHRDGVSVRGVGRQHLRVPADCGPERGAGAQYFFITS